MPGGLPGGGGGHGRVWNWPIHKSTAMWLYGLSTDYRNCTWNGLFTKSFSLPKRLLLCCLKWWQLEAIQILGEGERKCVGRPGKGNLSPFVSFHPSHIPSFFPHPSPTAIAREPLSRRKLDREEHNTQENNLLDREVKIVFKLRSRRLGGFLLCLRLF